jgi:hypothetical protein
MIETVRFKFSVYYPVLNSLPKTTLLLRLLSHSSALFNLMNYHIIGPLLPQQVLLLHGLIRSQEISYLLLLTRSIIRSLQNTIAHSRTSPFCARNHDREHETPAP